MAEDSESAASQQSLELDDQDTCGIDGDNEEENEHMQGWGWPVPVVLQTASLYTTPLLGVVEAATGAAANAAVRSGRPVLVEITTTHVLIGGDYAGYTAGDTRVEGLVLNGHTCKWRG